MFLLKHLSSLAHDFHISAVSQTELSLLNFILPIFKLGFSNHNNTYKQIWSILCKYLKSIKTRYIYFLTVYIE